jgi:hypothetical protein
MNLPQTIYMERLIYFIPKSSFLLYKCGNK